MKRQGFTIIELTVSIGLVLLLAVITATTLRVTVNNDAVRGAARQIQSTMAGARDRAIYAKAPRGVRFLLDPTNPRTVSSMVYVQQTPPWTTGEIQLERLDANNDGIADDFVTGSTNPLAYVVRGFDNDPNNPNAKPTEWARLISEGTLKEGARIRIPRDNGNWYQVSLTLMAAATGPGVTPYVPPRLVLTTAYLDAPTNTLDPSSPVAFTPPGGPRTYQIDQGTSLLPNSDIMNLPKGAVIHLDRCTNPANLEQATATAKPQRGDRLPSSWKVYSATSTDRTGFDYSSYMELMYSPQGLLVGDSAQRGFVHLYLATQKDADRDHQLYWSSTTYPTQSAPESGAGSDGYERGDKLIVTVATKTGTVSSHPVYVGPGPSDPFRYAESGEIAGR